MPRCITCDSCSEIDGTSPNSYWWSDKDLGYVCTPCRRAGYLYTPTFDPKLPEEVENLDEDFDLEGLALLAEPSVVRHSSPFEPDD